MKEEGGDRRKNVVRGKCMECIIRRLSIGFVEQRQKIVINKYNAPKILKAR